MKGSVWGWHSESAGRSSAKKLGKRFCKHYNRPPPPFTALLFLSVLRFLWQLILTDTLAQYPKNEILGISLTSNFVWSNPFPLRLCVCLWAEKKYKLGQISRLICSLSRWSAAAADYKVNWHWRTPVAIAQKIIIWHRGRKKRWFCFGSTRWRCTLAGIFLFHFVRGQFSLFCFRNKYQCLNSREMSIRRGWRKGQVLERRGNGKGGWLASFISERRRETVLPRPG